MNSVRIVIIVLIVVLIVWILVSNRCAERYKQMTLLPWCSDPISSLTPCDKLKRYYPGQRYLISCPAGNSYNPNTVSTWKLGKEINPVYR